MLTLHLPRDIQRVRESFKGTDPAALIVFAVATGLLAVILVAIYFR
ncbi:MAG: hypothetical protein WCH35_07350 [Comamonadaceae bacterium]